MATAFEPGVASSLDPGAKNTRAACAAATLSAALRSEALSVSLRTGAGVVAWFAVFDDDGAVAVLGLLEPVLADGAGLWLEPVESFASPEPFEGAVPWPDVGKVVGGNTTGAGDASAIDPLLDGDTAVGGARTAGAEPDGPLEAEVPDDGGVTEVETGRAGALCAGPFDGTLGLYVPGSFAAELSGNAEGETEGVAGVGDGDEVGGVEGLDETGEFVGAAACEPPTDVLDSGTARGTLGPSAERDISIYPSQMHRVANRL